MFETTYGRLTQTLLSLGFTIHEPEPRVRVYKHAESGAVIILPSFPDTDRVYGHHLTAVKMTLDAYGIATEPEFAS
jgi:hypothetical protein